MSDHDHSARPLLALDRPLLGSGRSPASGAGEASVSTEVLDAVKSEPRARPPDRGRAAQARSQGAGLACSAAQHGSEWRLLGGGRAAPYECRIGDRSLRIDAARTYFDANGHRLGPPGQAPDNLLFNRARYFREGNFRWTWSP